jgi:hypothetical protein
MPGCSQLCLQAAAAADEHTLRDAKSPYFLDES